MIPVFLGLVFLVLHFWDLLYGEEEDNKCYGDTKGNDKNDSDSEVKFLFHFIKNDIINTSTQNIFMERFAGR